MQFINSIDINIMSFIRDYFKCGFLDLLMPIISNLGNSGFIWIIISLILIFNKKYRFAGIVTLLTLLTAVVLGEGIIKNLVQRPRPYAFLDTTSLLVKVPNSYSFPSGHTSTAFGAALVLGNYFKKYKFLIFFFACVIGFSRVYLFVHFPSDVLGGIVIGAISYKLVTYLFNKYYKINMVEINE